MVEISKKTHKGRSSCRKVFVWASHPVLWVLKIIISLFMHMQQTHVLKYWAKWENIHNEHNFSLCSNHFNCIQREVRCFWQDVFKNVWCRFGLLLERTFAKKKFLKKSIAIELSFKHCCIINGKITHYEQTNICYNIFKCPLLQSRQNDSRYTIAISGKEAI